MPLRSLLPCAVDPSTDEARRLLEDELRKAEYHAEPLTDRLMRWIGDLLDRLLQGPQGGGPSGLSPLVTVVVALVVIGLLVWVLPKVRRERLAGHAPDGILTDPTTTARQYRERADRALQAGRFGEALLEGFRAIAKGTAERTLLDDAPGRTAHEVSLALAPRFPGEAGALAGSADLFDAVRYGGHPASRDEAAHVLQLDGRLAQTRPAPANGSARPSSAVPG